MLRKYDPEALLTVAEQLQLQRILILSGYVLLGVVAGVVLGYTPVFFSRLSDNASLGVLLGCMTMAALAGGMRTMWINAAAHAVLCYVAIEANTRQIAIALQRIELSGGPPSSPPPSPGSTMREPVPPAA